MGFADYLSRNPTGDAKPTSDEDKNFEINTIYEKIFTLLRNPLTRNGANNATNQIADRKQVANDAIYPIQTRDTANNAFCLNLFQN